MTQVGLCLIFLPFLVGAFRRSGLGDIEPTDLTIWFALTTFVFAAIALSAGLPEGVALQYTGAAFLALTLGYCRALLSMTLLVLITQPWETMGQTLLIDALLPTWFMLVLVKLSRIHLPANPFVFLLGCGFFGLFLVYALQELVSTAAMAVHLERPVVAMVFSEPTAWSLMLASGEVILEGMIITILVAFFPRAVVLFDDAYYLTPPPE